MKNWKLWAVAVALAVWAANAWAGFQPCVWPNRC